MTSVAHKTVFVGLSGGVDSAVAALRLKKAGYRVVGVFIKVWHPDFLDCNWETERLDAMRVAAALDIPFLTCDAEEAYKTQVAEYFIREYEAGRTPNPDVMCNQAVKFGAFLRFADEHGADFVATGHYARRIETPAGYELHRGVDTEKDQSYFLWTLTQAQLSRVLLPVGGSTKGEIRREAADAGIPVATKKDSQGICFLGHIDIPTFLAHYIDLHEGDVLDEHGNVIGTHQGAQIYTPSQRHGFSITEPSASRTPHFVTAKDVDANTITVNSVNPQTPKDSTMTLHEPNWIITEPTAGMELRAQTRYRQRPVPVHVSAVSAEGATLTLDAEHEAPAPGQSCVLYDGARCRGGGIIAE